MYWVVQCTSSRSERFPGRKSRQVKKNLEVAGDGKPNTSQLEAVFGHSLIINPSQAKGCIREYLRN